MKKKSLIWFFIPSLEHNDFVFVQIAQIQLLPFLYDIWVLLNHQPSNV